MKKKLRKLRPQRLLRRKQTIEQKEQAAIEAAPRITNETVAAHREEVLSSARKYIYPLQHSKHHIVVVSTALFIAATVIFFTYSTLALYRLQSTSTFVYRVTQVIPFPIAKAGGDFVAYENYLFELRHYLHYYENQLDTDFGEQKNKAQLDEFKKRALDTVVDYAYIKRLARENNVSVTDKEIEDQIAIVRTQNRLGGSDQVFEDVLKDFWGWSVADFKRSLRQQLLTQKVVASLDVETRARAENALAELKAGADFAAIAKAASDDEVTKERGGELDVLVDRTNPDLAAQTTDALFKLEPGQFSEIINIGYGLEIVKNLERNGERIRAAHILFNFKDADTYVNELKDKNKARLYISP